MYAWGDGGLGKLGNGAMTNTDVPVVVTLPAGVTAKAVATGYESAYAHRFRRESLRLGRRFYGELGDGTMTTATRPSSSRSPSGVQPVTIAGGGGVGYVIGSDGNLYSWGLKRQTASGERLHD